MVLISRSKALNFLALLICSLGSANAGDLNKLPNGDLFYGDIVNGSRQGMGAMIYKNGDKSVGEYVNDRCNGFFMYTKKSGEQFYQVCDSSGASSLVSISFDVTAGSPRNPRPSKWYLTGFSSDSIDLIDTSNIKRQGSVATFWSLMNLKEASSSPKWAALSLLSKMQADCDKDSLRVLYTYWYPERDGKGSFVHEENHEALSSGDSYWKPIPPTSDARYMLKKACKR